MKDRIKKIRRDAGLTQQEFADKLGLKQNTVASYEIARIIPSDRTIGDICRIFNVNEEWLRTGIGEMFVPRTRRDELAAYMGQVIGGKCSDIEEAIITVMARTSIEEWELIRKKALELLDEMKKPGQ